MINVSSIGYNNMTYSHLRHCKPYRPTAVLLLLSSKCHIGRTRVQIQVRSEFSDLYAMRLISRTSTKICKYLPDLNLYLMLIIRAYVVTVCIINKVTPLVFGSFARLLYLTSYIWLYLALACVPRLVICVV